MDASDIIAEPSIGDVIDRVRALSDDELRALESECRALWDDVARQRREAADKAAELERQAAALREFARGDGYSQSVATACVLLERVMAERGIRG